MKWFVFYEQGEGAISQSGMEDFDTQESAKVFAAKLLQEDETTSYYIIEGFLREKAQYGRVLPPTE